MTVAFSAKNIAIATMVVAILLALSELFVDMHGKFEFESIPVFYGLLAFGFYCFFIVLLKFWRLFVKRDQNFYSSPEDKHD